MDPALARHIDAKVRSEFNLPSDVQVALGARKPSKVEGYDSLPVTLSRGTKSQLIEFLISTDGKSLARLETYDLVNDPAFSINVTGRPVRGNPAAKVTVINFDDLECPYCAQMHRQLFPATLDHYKDKVKIVYRDLPLMEIHPWALRAAVDANCLAAQSGAVYWTYVDYLHAHGDDITGPERKLSASYDALDRIARQEATVGKFDAAGLARLDACLAKQDETQVRASVKEAEVLGIDGTPAVYVDGERVNGGAAPVEQVWAVIDRALRAQGIEPPPEPAPPAPAAAASAAAPPADAVSAGTTAAAKAPASAPATAPTAAATPGKAAQSAK
jgi:protein-disulfide isomerase